MRTQTTPFTGSYLPRAQAFASTLGSIWQAACQRLKPAPVEDPAYVHAVKVFILASMAECHGVEAGRLRMKVERASTELQLLALREHLFARIAHAKWQGAAIEFVTTFDHLTGRACPGGRRARK